MYGLVGTVKGRETSVLAWIEYGGRDYAPVGGKGVGLGVQEAGWLEGGGMHDRRV